MSTLLNKQQLIIGLPTVGGVQKYEKVSTYIVNAPFIIQFLEIADNFTKSRRGHPQFHQPCVVVTTQVLLVPLLHQLKRATTQAMLSAP